MTDTLSSNLVVYTWSGDGMIRAIDGDKRRYVLFEDHERWNEERQKRWGTTVAQKEEEIERLRAALVGAVEVIQTWHNMPLGTGRLPSNAWDIYWRNAPEMKPIREALSNAVETKP